MLHICIIAAQNNSNSSIDRRLRSSIPISVRRIDTFSRMSMRFSPFGENKFVQAALEKRTGEQEAKRGWVVVACMSHRISIVKRSKGKSCVASAAYRFGENIKDKRTGKTHYYASKSWEVAYKEVLLPANAPQEWKNISTLMNEIERREKRGDAQLVRSIFFALPKELTHEQNIALVKELAQKSFVSKGICVAVAIHDKRDGNPHCHVLLTMREIDGDHFGKKYREWNEWTLAQEWMQNYQDITNKHYELADRPERICAKSFKEQGIDRIPTVHEGYYATVLKKQGLPSRQGDINREIAEKNRQIAVCDKALAKVEALLQKKQEALANEKRIDEMYRKAAEARKQPPLRELTPEEFLEYQKRTQQRGYHPEPRRLLESEFANPDRRKDEQEQSMKKEEEHHKRPQREHQRKHERGLEH